MSYSVDSSHLDSKQILSATMIQESRPFVANHLQSHWTHLHHTPGRLRLSSDRHLRVQYQIGLIVCLKAVTVRVPLVCFPSSSLISLQLRRKIFLQTMKYTTCECFFALSTLCEKVLCKRLVSKTYLRIDGFYNISSWHVVSPSSSAPEYSTVDRDGFPSIARESHDNINNRETPRRAYVKWVS